MKKATITPKVHIMPGRVTRGDTARSLSSLKHSGKFCFAALSYSFSCSAFGEVACVNISRKMCFLLFQQICINSVIYIPSRFAFSWHSHRTLHRTILQYFWLNVRSAMSTHRALLFCGGSRDDRLRQMSHCIGNARSSTARVSIVSSRGPAVCNLGRMYS